MMTIRLNGENKATQAATIAELLTGLQSPESGVAVALNGAVIRRAEHQSTALKDGDEVEIIRAVQGG